MMRAPVAMSASGSISHAAVIGTETGTTPLIRAKTGIIANEGAQKASDSPGSASARMAEARMSSEPHPVTIHDWCTPAYAPNASFNANAYAEG